MKISQSEGAESREELINSRGAESHMLCFFAGNEEVSTPQGKELTVSYSDGAETQSLAA